MSTADCTFVDDFVIVVVGNPLSPLSKSRRLGERLGDLMAFFSLSKDPLRQGGSGGSDMDASLLGVVARRMSIGSFSSSR